MGAEKSKSCLGVNSVNLYSIRALNGIVHGGRHSKLGVFNVTSMNAGYKKSGCSIEIKSKGIDKKEESGITVIKSDELAVSWDNDIFVSRYFKLMCLVSATARDNRVLLRDIRGGQRVVRERGDISEIDRFSDEDTAVEMLAVLKGERSEKMEKRFEVRDLVWAKIKSYPWWPGYIYDEAFASSDVLKTKIDGCLLVAFFGDDTYNWLDQKELIPFDSHYYEKSKQSSSKPFVMAVEHAVYEVNRRAALGLACPCTSTFQPTTVEKIVNIDMRGYEPEDYPMEQIEKARQEFQPVKTLSFLQQLALGCSDVPQDIPFMREAARVLAFRRAVYEKVDEPYFEAFGVNPVGHGDSNVLSNNQELAFAEDFVARTRHTSRISQDPGEGKGLAKLTINYQKKNNRYVSSHQDERKAVSSHQDERKASRFCHFSKGSHDHVSNREAVPVPLKPKINGKQNVDKIVGQETIAPSLGSTKDTIHVNMKPVVAKTSLEKRSEFHFQQKASLNGQSMIAESQSKRKHVKTVQLPKLRDEPMLSTSDHFSKTSGDHVSIKSSKIAGTKLEVGGKKNVTQALWPSENENETSILDKKPLILNASSADVQIFGKNKPVEILVASRDDVDKKPSNMVETKLKRKEAPIVDVEPIVVQPRKSPSKTSGANLKDLPSDLKSLKKRFQPSNPVEGGKRVVISDHQKEMTRKRQKIQNDIQSLASAKTMLSMKFPPKVTLPSVSELKAKFARFGPLHTSGIRVLWKSSACKVPFMNRCDAQRAYLQAVNLGTLFGNTKVTFHLHDIDISKPELAESRELGKLIFEEACDRGPPLSSDSDESFQPINSPVQAIIPSSSSYMDGIEDFADAINMKYLQVVANKTSTHQTADFKSVDISEQMLTLLTDVNEIVTKLKHP